MQIIPPVTGMDTIRISANGGCTCVLERKGSIRDRSFVHTPVTNQKEFQKNP